MQIVHGHTGTDNENTVVAQTLQRLTDAVMLIRIFIAIERDLYDWHIQRILFRIES